jgi:hypothetical protein
VSEIKPILLSIQPWDAEKGTSVYYTYTGSKQAMDNELVVTDTANGEIVYTFSYSSFERVHHLPPREFINGKIYKAKIRVKLSDGTYSPYSNEVEFRTFKTPILDIISIDGEGFVYNQDVTFQANYTQADGELVKTYRFSLYDENEDLILNYPIRTPSVASVLSETITGLERGKGYFIECLIETVNGVVWTHREKFIPMYIVPSANGLIQTVNDYDEGVIRITTNLKQITGTQVKGTPQVDNDGNDSNNYSYINDEWIVIPKERPIIFQGLGMSKASDFVMKLWCKNIPNGTKFAEVSPPENTGIAIQFWKYDNKIVAVKEFNGVTSRYRSNIVTIPSGAEFMVYAKVVEHRIDLSLKIL